MSNLSERVNGRITTEEKDQMKKLGFTVRDAIQTKILLMSEPKKRMQFKIKTLKEKKQELIYDEVAIDILIEELEKRYNKLKDMGRII